MPLYLPIRHHSPACAWHVGQVIRERQPAVVLIEGPADATELIPLLLHEDTSPPVALFTTYVRQAKEKDRPRERFAAYYPFTSYCPEWTAMQAGTEVGARVAFIDLTYPQMVEAESLANPAERRNLMGEHHLQHERFLDAACQRARVRDPDELWDHLFETSYRDIDSAEFFERVATYCRFSRDQAAPEALAADGTLAREAAMAAAVAEAGEDCIVVTGGFHSVVLAETKPGLAPPLSLDPADAITALIAYGDQQVDRLNGYSSGMPSPAFYRRLWEANDSSEPIVVMAHILVDLARSLREQNIAISSADEIACLDQVLRLAELRGHPIPGREDLMDGVRSVFINGAEDVEGVAVMACLRMLLAGGRVGRVTSEAGQPPIVADFHERGTELGLKIRQVRPSEVVLDLYRRRKHRALSRFLFQLAFLDIPFAKRTRGPDFVRQEDLDRVQEAWVCRWSPETESALIEAALYGTSVEIAALNRLKRVVDTMGHQSGDAAGLLLEACRMGLHQTLDELLELVRRLIAGDPDFASLVRAMDVLMMLQTAREPLEAHNLKDLPELASQAYDRACYLLADLGTAPAQRDMELLEAVRALLNTVQSLGDNPARQALRWDACREILADGAANPAMQGAALGLLFVEGELSEAELATAFAGQLRRPNQEEISRLLLGLLGLARDAVFHHPAIMQTLHHFLRDLDETSFRAVLPGLRFAFTQLTGREAARLGECVLGLVEVSEQEVAAAKAFTSEDFDLAATVEESLRPSLKSWGLTP